VRTAAQPPNPIALLDSAFDLLRVAPPSAWLIWAAGSLPFGFGLIAFVSEMTTSANAEESLASHALALALLFLWMIVSQALFAQCLWPVLAVGSSRSRSALAAQAIIGSTALIMLPVGALSIVGFPWIATFYYTATAFPASSGETGTAAIFRYASRQASTWSFLSVIDLAIAALFGLVVFVNVLVSLIAGPILFRTITGEETAFTTNANGMLNSTLFTAALVITWLLMDPLLRAAFIIRCFRVDAIRSGVDLKATLARCAKTAAVILLIVIPIRAGALSVQPHKLDRSIREVTSRPEFLWREPRQTATAASTNAFLRFTQDAVQFIGDTIHRAFDWIAGVIRAILRWLLNEKQDEPAEGPGGSNVPFVAPALYILMAITAGAAIALLMQLRIRRRAKEVAAPAASATEALDLTSGDVSPDQAPEDEWLALAARLLDAGDLRLATRALYLAVLASLGESGLITIHRARSNLDYQRELGRRARGNTNLLSAFRELVATFERTWYGEHRMSRDAFDRLRAGALEMRARGQV
jgi:hypothetical protein